MNAAAGIDRPSTFGRYRILRRIARGGMTEILLAVEPRPDAPDRVVVIKRVHAELAANQELCGMLLDEARLALKLQHPNIGQVLEVGQLEDQPYLVTEYLPGEDLASILQQARRVEKVLPMPLALKIVANVAAGLGYAHKFTDDKGQPQAVVHRDVSPSNVVVTYSGDVKLVDFGVARAEANLIRTASGMHRRKLQYLSPEQATDGPIDHRSDIFSAGVILYELLTGQRLFKRDTDQGTIQAVFWGDIPPPSAGRSEIPPAVDRICLRALARERAARYQHAAELAKDLTVAFAATGGRPNPTALGDFLAEVFPSDRREKKLRLVATVAPLEPLADRTPGSLSGFTPVHTNTMLTRPGPVLPVRSAAEAPRAVSPPPVPKPRAGARWDAAVAVLLVIFGFGLGTLFGTLLNRPAAQPEGARPTALAHSPAPLQP